MIWNHFQAEKEHLQYYLPLASHIAVYRVMKYC